MMQTVIPRFPMPLPTKPPRWITAFCAWGDCIISVGIAQECRRRWPDAEFGLVFAGRDDQLYEWLLEQQYEGYDLFSHSMRLYAPKGDTEWSQFVGAMCCEPQYRGIVDCYLEAHGIDHARALQAHITRELQTFWTPYLARELTISGNSMSEAAALMRANGLSPGEFIVCLPFSHQSTDPGEFWPATRGLMKQLPKVGLPVVVLGQKWSAADTVFDGTIDLRDQTSRNDVVFEMAARSAGVIATCNSLTHYCAAMGVPCVVMPNKKTSDVNSIFRVALEMGPSIRMMGWRDSATKAMTALRIAIGK